MEDCRGARVSEAGPSSAVRVLGLSEVPEAGGDWRVMPDEVRRDDVITLGVITLSLK